MMNETGRWPGFIPGFIPRRKKHNLAGRVGVDAESGAAVWLLLIEGPRLYQLSEAPSRRVHLVGSGCSMLDARAARRLGLGCVLRLAADHDHAQPGGSVLARL